MKTEFASTDYEDLTLPQRCNAMAEARDMARDDIDQHQVDIVPFTLDDPRRSAYLAIVREAIATEPRYKARIAKRNEAGETRPEVQA